MDDAMSSPENGANEAAVIGAGEGTTETVVNVSTDQPALETTGAADDEIAVLTAERDALRKDYDEAKASLLEAMGALDTRTAERDALQARFDAMAAAPKAKPTSRTARLRKAGPMENPAAEDLLAAISEATTVELVFSDGKAELAAVTAIEVAGNAWAKFNDGIALRLPELMIGGAAVGQSGWPLQGYALFLDGKQAAWAPRPDVLVLGGGRQFNLRDDVWFPPALAA